MSGDEARAPKRRPNLMLRRQFILPGEHGAWIWLAGPLLVGTAAGDRLTGDLGWLLLAAISAFAIRQPATILVKVLSGRRRQEQLVPGALWLVIYLAAMLAAVTALLRLGHGRIVWLAAVGAPVFAWHLWLVSRRSERDRPGVEVVASGVLALAAPAAYWIAGGGHDQVAWSLWILLWLQSGASIVHVHFRLGIRKGPGNRSGSAISPWRALGYHAVAAAASATAVYLQAAPLTAPLAFSIPLIDGVMAIRRSTEASARSIGTRQLLVSSLFVVVMAIGYLPFSPGR